MGLYLFSMFSGVMFGLLALVCKKMIFLMVLFEVMSMVFMSCFFLNLGCKKTTKNKFYKGVTMFFVVSCVSSILLFSGWLLDSFLLVFAGACFKLGLFPFSGWVADVYVKTKWFSILMMSTVYKFPLLLIMFLMGGFFLDTSICVFLFMFTLFYAVLNFVWGMEGVVGLVISMSLSSSSLILVFGLYGSGCVFLMYILFGWLMLFFVIFGLLRKMMLYSDLSLYSFGLMFFLIFPFPWSLGVMYKLWGVYGFSKFLGWWFIIAWWLYSFFEQVYLYLVLSSKGFSMFKWYVEGFESRLVSLSNS